MKAVRIHSYGDSHQLQLEEAPRPRPAPDEVLVAVHSAGVNPLDWKVREGYLRQRRPAEFPLTVGQDLAGEVAEVGAEVGEYQPGDRIFGFGDGAYAEYAAVAVSGIARLPEALSYDIAASLPTPGVTAYQLVTRAARVARGETVLIHGAAGAVGTLAVQLARLQGARVIATALGRDTEYVASLGAATVLDNRTERFEDEVPAVDAVIDLVGGEVLQRSYAVVRRGGVVATTVGPMDPAEADRRDLRTVEFVMRRDAGDLATLARLVEQGQLRPRIAKVLPFPDARQAQDLNQAGQAHGKVILRVA